MAVLSRLLFSSAERVDLADFLSIDSYAAADFKYMVKSFVGDTVPYILKGFDVINPAVCIGTNSCSIRVADSVVYFPASNVGSFFFGLPEGNPVALPVVPSLRSNATNYIYLTFTTQELASDSRAFWDPDKNGGDGGEFSQEVNTESILAITVNTSVSTFPDATIPIAKITTGPTGSIQTIQDCRHMMFRLGTGGSSPNPYSNYTYRNLPSAPYARNEPPTVMSTVLDPNPFQGGDKNIQTLKEWMDAVMTKIKELSGSPYWYTAVSNISVPSVFQDALGSVLKSKGVWQHDGSLPGHVTWTEDIVQKSLQDPHDVIIRAGDAQLSDEQVAFITLVRNADINSGPSSVNFYNGLNYVNGILNAFQFLSVGDWIRKKTDTDDMMLRVENFYSGSNLTGTAGVAPSLALSAKLSSNYAGSTASVDAVYTKGIYQPADVQVVNRNNSALQTAGGNLFWLVARSDTIMAMSNVTSYTINGTIIASDSVTATISSTSHGLVDGDRLEITGTLTGTYVVEVQDANTFSIADTSSLTGAIVGTYVLVTTTSRSNADATIQLEDANHTFETNETVLFEDSTHTSSTQKPINYRSPTTFQIAASLPFTPDTTWTVAGVRVHVRKAFGSIRIVQGESIEIGEIDGVNIQKYIGMSSLSETYPTYMLPPGYNTLAGQENFNTLSTDDLTQRAAKLTAMMADRIQDRGLQLRSSVTIRNTTNAGNQDITASNTVILDKPKSPSQTVTLGCSIPVNSAGVVVLDREGSGALTVSIESLGSNFLLEENKLILFYRLADNNVYAWDGHVIPPNGTYTVHSVEHTQNKNITIFYPAEVSLNLNPASLDFNKLHFQDNTVDVTISIPGSSDYNTLDTALVNDFVVLDGKSVWVRIDRHAAKVFNTLQTSDVPDTTANGAVYVTDTSIVPIEQDVVVLYERIGTALLGMHRAEQLQGNVYEEIIDVVTSPTGSYQIGAVPSGTNISLPPDSRDNGNQQFYIYDSGQLEVFLNGQMIYQGRDWDQVVGSPIPSVANQIQILRDLVVGDALAFRVDTTGSVYFANTSAISFTLQDGYNAGRFITINSGQPVVISGPIGEKLLHVAGDMQVDGVVDPTAITFIPQPSSPIPLDQAGIWSDSTGNMMYQKGDTLPPINILSSITSPESASLELLNNTGSIILKATPTSVNSSGDMDLVDVSNESQVRSCIGLTTNSVDDGNYGFITTKGVLKNISTFMPFGSVVYIAKNGSLTNSKPTQGIDGFVTGDFSVKVGVIVKDRDNPLQKNLVVDVQVVEQLYAL